MWVKDSGVLSRIELNSFKRIEPDRRIFLIPIIVGGIVSPLALLTLFNSSYNPWIILVLLFSGIFSLYYGFQGGDALTIYTTVKDYHFFTSSTTPELRQFCRYANNIKTYGASGILFYFVLNSEYKLLLSQDKPLKVSELPLLFRDEPKPNEYMNLAGVHPAVLKEQLYFKLIQNELRPYLKGTIDSEQLILP